jgi:phospholipid N-methyltransferase
MSLNKLDFLIESVKNLKNSGTITQSSPYLCKKMVSHLQTNEHKYIAEFGTGDGVITKHILDKLPPDGKLLAFEINENLFEQLKKINDPRLIPIYDSAESLGTHMEKHGIEALDSVISSIPFVVLPTELTLEILLVAKTHLKKGGLFVQFNYTKILKDLYKSVFHNYTTEYVLLNTPPAFVFRCIKK